MKKNIKNIITTALFLIVAVLTLGIVSFGTIYESVVATSESGGGFYVGNNSTFILDSSKSISGFSATNGGGIYVNENGKLDITGGILYKNIATNNGAGVFNNGTFTLVDGVISSNEAKLGGGVYNAGNFTMSGGVVSNNIGGGVYNAGTFNMSGGVISNNDFAGVYNNGAFTMTGGFVSGGKSDLYTRVDSNGNESASGNYILFGSYPKTIKASDVTIDKNDVDGRGYYLGSDGERYAKVNANPGGSSYVYSDGTKISSGIDYYFKVEPIKWRILNEVGGEAIILAEDVLTSNIPFYTSTQSRTIDGTTIYSNNYEYSTIRAWLNSYNGLRYSVLDYSKFAAGDFQNNGFLNQAFTEEEQNAILTTEIDNSASSTNSSTNNYACNNTKDKIWLLGYQDALNYDFNKQKVTTDFARANRAYYSTDASSLYNGYWWLRSPTPYYEFIVWDVSASGNISSDGVGSIGRGVVPAIKIDLNSFGIYNTETMNLYGGTVDGNVGSNTSFNVKSSFKLSGKFVLGNNATINLVDYKGITPSFEIKIYSSREAGTIMTFVGSKIEPDLSKITIIGNDPEKTCVITEKDENGNWTIAFVYEPRTVTFDPQFGTVSEESRSVNYGEKIGKLPVPTREGYLFSGWYTAIQNSSINGTKINENFIVKDNCILYAWWSVYLRVDEKGNESERGNYVLFGSYPKTIKANDVTIDTSTVDSNGYYIGSDGEKYAKYAATPYDNSYVFSNGSKIYYGEYYYYKIEPIKWRIISENNGKAIIVAEDILVAGLEIVKKTRTVEGTTIYANNYKYSRLRAWLNSYDASGYDAGNYSNNTAGEYLASGFYNLAFTQTEKNIILTTSVDNTAPAPDGASNPYSCENTNDKVWLLSYQEVKNTNYGFSRQKTPTDFARARCAYYSTDESSLNCGKWWLRSPSPYYEHVSWDVNHLSEVVSDGVDNVGIGVVPAITISLASTSTSNFVSNYFEKTEETENEIVTKQTINENANQKFEAYIIKNVEVSAKQDLFFEKKKFNLILKAVQENNNEE